MSLFPRSFYTPDQSFAPLVRLLNDWDTYSRDPQQQQLGHPHHGGRHHGTGAIQTFNPKFDVLETDTEYQLHGELGGIAKKDVNIEFTDEHTLVVKGRVEKSYTTSEPAEAEGVSDEEEGGATSAADNSNGHKATARDEEEEKRVEGAHEVATTKKQHVQKPTFKYWLSERSVGEFSRVFQFPGRVERDGVSASLENGILTVKVPKAKKVATRRIDIS